MQKISLHELKNRLHRKELNLSDRIFLYKKIKRLESLYESIEHQLMVKSGENKDLLVQ